MRIILACPCPSDYFGKKSHRKDCTEVCPYMTSSDRYSAPKRCGKPIKRINLCAAQAGAKERLAIKQMRRSMA